MPVQLSELKLSVVFYTYLVPVSIEVSLVYLDVILKLLYTHQSCD